MEVRRRKPGLLKVFDVVLCKVRVAMYPEKQTVVVDCCSCADDF